MKFQVNNKTKKHAIYIRIIYNFPIDANAFALKLMGARHKQVCKHINKFVNT